MSAGWCCRPSRAWTSCMTMAAALAAMATILQRRSAVVDLAVLDAQALALEGAEELLDGPSRRIPFDDAPGLGRGFRRVGGEQVPMNGVGAARRIEFADLHDADRGYRRAGRGRRCCAAVSDSIDPKRMLELGACVAAGRGARAARQRRCRRGGRSAIARRTVPPPASEGGVASNAGQQMNLPPGGAAPVGEELAFAVVDDGDGGGRGEDRPSGVDRC